jgi:hypothetical protein
VVYTRKNLTSIPNIHINYKTKITLISSRTNIARVPMIVLRSMLSVKICCLRLEFAKHFLMNPPSMVGYCFQCSSINSHDFSAKSPKGNSTFCPSIPPLQSRTSANISKRRFFPCLKIVSNSNNCSATDRTNIVGEERERPIVISYILLLLARCVNPIYSLLSLRAKNWL